MLGSGRRFASACNPEEVNLGPAVQQPITIAAKITVSTSGFEIGTGRV